MIILPHIHEEGCNCGRMPLTPTGKDVSVLEKYIRSQAVRDALKAILPFAQETIKEENCVTYAKACYARKAISKSGVDLSEDTDIPLPNRNTTFLTSMFRSLEHDYVNFETVCEVLRGFPEVAVVAEKMEAEYGMNITLATQCQYECTSFAWRFVYILNSFVCYVSSISLVSDWQLIQCLS